MPCAAKESDSNSPPFTRSRTFSRICFSCWSFCRLISSSSEFRMGSPARISVRNCWLKTRNVVLLQLLPPRSETAGHHALRLDPINEVSLGRETVAHLGFGVALLDVLVHAPAIVRDFDYKFRHLHLVISRDLVWADPYRSVYHSKPTAYPKTPPSRVPQVTCVCLTLRSAIAPVLLRTTSVPAGGRKSNRWSAIATSSF